MVNSNLENSIHVRRKKSHLAGSVKPKLDSKQECSIQSAGLKKSQSETTAAPQTNLHQIFDMLPFPAMITNSAGCLLEANKALAELLNIGGRLLRGKPFVVFLARMQQASFFSALKKAQRSGEPVKCSLMISPRFNSITRSVAATVQQISGTQNLLWTLSPADEELQLKEELQTYKSAALSSQLEMSELRTNSDMLIRTKNEFIAYLTHELRTPMQAVCGAAELLRRSKSPQEQEELISILATCTKQMKDVADSALTFSAAELGATTANLSNLSLTELLSSIYMQFAAEAQSKGIHLRVQTIADVPEVIRSDSVRLRQILLNLVTNSLKFVRANHISITVEVIGQGKDRLLFTICDTGSGMSSEALSKLFDPFVCANEESRARGGTGIGLHISKRLVESLNGNIVVESPVEGGCKILFTIPLLLPSTSAPSPCDSTGSAQPCAAVRILLAEDSDVVAKVLGLQLKQLGCDIVRVPDGQQAVERAMTEEFDLVLMDCQMPVLNGYEATRSIRQNSPRCKEVPIVALTANVGHGEEDRCIAAGMNCLISKPVSTQVLRDVVSSLVKVK